MIPSRNVVNIINNTLNLVDPRLINHGGRVAGHVYQVLRARGGMDDKTIRDICLLAVLHDIGAYKTEEIDRMVEFETEEVWSHSIYGFLFLKYLSPLTHLTPALFFHHASVPQLRHCHPEYHQLAQIIHIADRLDIMTQIVGGFLPTIPSSAISGRTAASSTARIWWICSSRCFLRPILSKGRSRRRLTRSASRTTNSTPT
ncbi:MAG: hypothetical protein LUE17_04965 [Planctomycetaceae bacterium]|nr:hypothetical protein [Planctomycetaceae bacterium]